jgi:hypothetical protein
LSDSDCGSNTPYLVNIRLIHSLEELAGIGRQRLDIPALAFGINGVERQG